MQISSIATDGQQMATATAMPIPATSTNMPSLPQPFDNSYTDNVTVGRRGAL